MTVDEAAGVFSALNAGEQLRFLALFGHILTVAARDTYEFQAPGVRAPERLRAINEIQHRLLSHIYALLAPGEWRYPNDALVSIMLAEDDLHLHSQAIWAFEQSLTKVKGVPSA